MCFALFTFVVDYKAYYCRTEDNGTGLIVMWSHHRLWVASLFVILLYLIDVFKKHVYSFNSSTNYFINQYMLNITSHNQFKNILTVLVLVVYESRGYTICFMKYGVTIYLVKHSI